MELLITLGGKELLIRDSIFNTWVVVIALILFALSVKKKIEKAKLDEAPSGFLNVVETYVEMVQSLVTSTMGAEKIKYAPFILTIFTFLVVANLFGLLGFTPPTSDYSVTLALALVTFILVQTLSIRSNGFFGYLKGFFEPYVLLSPLNIIGELANPISLSFRLFGNIMSGGLIMTLIYGALGMLAPIIAPPLHIYFDIFSGVLQAFIFTMLTMVFVGGAE